MRRRSYICIIWVSPVPFVTRRRYNTMNLRPWGLKYPFWGRMEARRARHLWQGEAPSSDRSQCRLMSVVATRDLWGVRHAPVAPPQRAPILSALPAWLHLGVPPPPLQRWHEGPCQRGVRIVGGGRRRDGGTPWSPICCDNNAIPYIKKLPLNLGTHNGDALIMRLVALKYICQMRAPNPSTVDVDTHNYICKSKSKFTWGIGATSN
jgi:hypothetical protein